MTKTLVTGGTGLVGNAFKKFLPDAYFPDRKELNLLDRNSVFDYFEKHEIDTVIHIAAKVGGVAANTNFVADFYSENIQMNTNLIDACVSKRVPKLVCCLSTCIYPDEEFVKYPLTEDQLHIGAPHRSNFGYAYAKRMVDVQLQAICQQYGLNYMSVIPNNLYGEHDNFDLSNGHVLPALIRKIWEAKIQSSPSFEVWGDGEVYREFTYAEDICKTIQFCLSNYKESEPINIGNAQEYLLKDVIAIICRELNYSGEIVYNTNKLKGQVRKPTSNKKFLNLGWEMSAYTPLEVGLQKTCKWFVENYPTVRGVK